MLKIIAAVIELAVVVLVFWVLSFLSGLLHELGHAAGYMLATGDRGWHIRVGWGKRLFCTKRLTVNLLVFDGFFTPSKNEFATKGKLIMTLLGGPVESLILVLGLLALRFGGLSFESEILADGAIESLVNTALFINLFTLILSLAPIHYFHGEMKGTESDGLQVVHIIKGEKDQ